MKYIDFTLPSPAQNLAADEALLDLAEDGLGGEILRFWEPRTAFVVLGYANRAASEADLEACQRENISVLRRCSGGGTVLQGSGCLNYTLIRKIEPDGPFESIALANRFIMQKHQLALQTLLQRPVQIQGHTDLTLADLKFSGNAQCRKRHFLIFHGTFLLNFDISLVEKFLRLPVKQPAYRENRAHSHFLTNLNLPAWEVKHALRMAWGAREESTAVPLEKIHELARQKYSTAEWNFKF